MDDRDFVIENGVLTGYHGPGGAVIVPEGVLAIGEEAFSGCARLGSVTLPAGLERIGNFAFSCCSGLTELTLPEGLKLVERSAFRRCTGLRRVSLPSTLEALGEFAFVGCRGLEEIALPPGLSRIGPSAFSGCSRLERVALPEGLRRLEKSVFYGCARLTEALLPGGLETVDTGAFAGCGALRRVAVEAENPYLKDLDGVLYSRDGARLLLCPGGLRELAVPEGVAEIGGEAFSGNAALDRVALPATLRRIGASAFRGCTALTEFHFPAGLETVGPSAFEGCGGLARLVLPDGLREVGESAFRGCAGLLWLALPEGLPFDLHWFAAPNDPPCLSVDRTGVPFASTRPIADIGSALGTRRAALGFIRAENDGVTVRPEIAAGYTAYIREHGDQLYGEMLSDDELLRWMAEREAIRPGDVEELLERAAARGRAGASVLLLDYKKRHETPLTSGGQLDGRFEALENALDF